ncbi:VOC family protein [Oligoflexaceae bacterium]|nr:VOC family protein [Oligoflexaceae bacterium]
MKIQRLDHLNLSVENLEETVDWYQDLFGFEVKERGESRGEPWAIIQSGLASLCLYQRSGFCRHDADKDEEEQKITLNHFAFAIESEADWLASVGKHRPEMRFGGEVTVYPSSRSWYVVDPNGFQIEVCVWSTGRPEF